MNGAAEAPKGLQSRLQTQEIAPQMMPALDPEVSQEDICVVVLSAKTAEVVSRGELDGWFTINEI
jgi:hypothetical protein